MKRTFQAYGQVVTFDITYNIVANKSKDQANRIKSYGLGLFGGLSSTNKIICFAVALINDETS